jgi:subtilisin family serine protease
MSNSRIILTVATIALLLTVVPLSAVSGLQAAGISTQPFQVVEANNLGINQLPPFAPGVVLVGLKQGVSASIGVLGAQVTDPSLSSTFTKLGVQDIEPVFSTATSSSLTPNASSTDFDLSHIYRLRLSPDADVLRIVQDLNAHPAVQYAEPDYLAHIIAIPNDPEYSSQWGLAKINAPVAWDVVTGTTDVVIAIIDAGIDVTHPDLSGQLWQNPGEIVGNGIDDDNNGYVDDIHGWSLVNNNADLSDNTGHGTEVAGIIAATTDNGVGIAGVCWQCRLMVVKVVQPGGVANYSDIAAGVAYAAQKGAKVINISLGGNSDSITLKTAIANAAQTAMVVAGAGNENGSALFYPAAYDDYVLAVAGTTQTDSKVGTSNYGMWVDVSAPGEAITTTFSGSSYGSSSGTSMAAPFAAGLAGLLRSQHPDWSPNQVRATIIHTANNIDSLNPSYAGKLGSGRINAQAAVNETPQPELSLSEYTVNGVTNGTPAPSSTVDLVVRLYNNWGNAGDSAGVLSSTDPYVSIITNSASVGTIGTYATGNNASPFVFSILAAPDGHPMAFMLNVSANGGAFNVSIPLTITTQSGTLNVNGPIPIDTTWTSNKVYVVTDDVSVSSGVALTIQPGTLVKFNPGRYMLVRGRLTAVGTSDRRIRFTSNSATPAPGDWGRGYEGGIFFYECNSSSAIQYATIEYGTGISIQSCSPTIEDNTIRYNHNTPSNGSAISVRSPSTSLIANNLITKNSGDFGCDCGGAISIMASPTVTGNRIIDNQGGCGGGISSCSGGSGLIANNIIWGNTGWRAGGIHCTGTPGIPTLDGNSVADNVAIYGGGDSWETGGGMFAGGATHNTVANNRSDGTGSSDNGGAVIGNGSGFAASANLNNWINSGDTYVFGTIGAGGVNAKNNYWGTTDPSTIAARIYDGNDGNWQLGAVEFEPFSTIPITTAPAFLWQLSLSPISPVGIGPVTSNLTFSRPMDQSFNPTVSFGSGNPYDTYQVIGNAQWLDDTHWRATYDITSLVPRGTYTISAGGAKGLNGMEIPTDTRFGFTVGYAGQITDQTPPNVPSVIAGGKEGDSSSVEAMWWASDPDSSITSYRYAIGSAPGATDIVNWTMTSNNLFTRSGLGLVEGRQYWVAVQARNIGGLWSPSGYSAFVVGQPLRKVFLPLVLRGL